MNKSKGKYSFKITIEKLYTYTIIYTCIFDIIGIIDREVLQIT